MKSALFAALIGITTFSIACGDDTTPTADSGLPDAASRDAGSDPDQSGGTDAGRSANDMAMALDSSTSDTGNDPGDMNGGADAGSSSDLGADQGPADDMQAGDAGAGPCVAGYTAIEEVAGQLVACQGAADTLNQCDAEDVCGAGWHMCTATEYRTHFESAEPMAASEATFWLASCIRDGADPMAPSDTVCSDCTGTQTGANADVSFSCVNALTLETEQLHVGLRAGTACTFAGVDEPGNDAFWNAQPSSALQAGAFCCID